MNVDRAPVADPTGPLSGKARPACILIVDDQPANLQIAGAALGRHGHEIIPATDGVAALRRLGLRKVDLILLDLLMPGMDGFEVCRRLGAHPEWKDIPVIFLSAADDKDLVVQALESGGVDYITKPFHHAELVLRVHTQLALKSARDHLRRLAEDKDELLGILAHDLKNHLGGVLLSAENLLERLARAGSPADPRAVRLAGNIAETSGGLLTFVKEFLANAAADRGIPLHATTVSLSKAVETAITRYRDAARRKQLTVNARITGPDGDTTVMADPSGIDQVLDNLISNAIKFSPPGADVDVAVWAEPGRGVVEIRDHGPGFTDADRVRLFQRYARLSARPTGGEPSTGLGLSIVHRLAHAMGGEISCDSAPGRGATFVVRLPGPALESCPYGVPGN